VELRPDLGGAAFERPAGITFAEVDPETGYLATSSCPQSERVAITAALAPNIECRIHGEFYDLEASIDGEAYDYEPMSITEYESGRQATRVISANSRPRPLPRPVVEVERLEAPEWQTTRVETTTRGGRTLVNEIRVISPSRTGSAYKNQQR
jgi:hypothetical protein